MPYRLRQIQAKLFSLNPMVVTAASGRHHSMRLFLRLFFDPRIPISLLFARHRVVFFLAVLAFCVRPTGATNRSTVCLESLISPPYLRLSGGWLPEHSPMDMFGEYDRYFVRFDYLIQCR